LNVKKRFTEEQIIGFLREGEAGLAVAELCRRHGFSEASYYLWRSKFGGMNVSDAKRLKELEAENTRLKRLLAEPMLENEVTKEALRKKWWAHRPDANCWRKEYNDERPKKSLGGLTPAAYAKTLIQKPVKSTPDSKAQCYWKWGTSGLAFDRIRKIKWAISFSFKFALSLEWGAAVWLDQTIGSFVCRIAVNTHQKDNKECV